MSDASKILTVSYGTFSCTLEGFNDPFNTMKAIAEYFRDLAAGDRYFGAEPPTPDAAMLHAIAEREIHRRVEAKIQENGVILRAADDDLPTLDAPRPAAMPAAEPSLDALNPDAGGDSVAAKLQRIRAKHTKAPAIAASAVVSAALSDEDDNYSEDEHAEDLPMAANFVPDAFAEIASPAAEEVADEIEIPDHFEDLQVASDRADAYAAAFDEAANEAPKAEDAADDDLAILNAVNATTPTTTPAAETPAAETPVAETIYDLSDDEDFADDGELLARLEDKLPEDDLQEEIASDPIAHAEQDDDALLASLGAMIDPEDSDDDLMLDAQDAVSTESESFMDAADQAPAEPETEAAAAEAEPTEIGEKLQRARARVIRIRRADAPAVVAPPVDTTVETVAETGAPSLLSDEAEADLQAELAALEAELDGDSAPPAAKAAAPAAAAPVANLRRRLVDDDGDAAVNRLIEHANSEMDGEDTRRRQSAISHLKAAVAATVADRKVTGTEPAGDGHRQDAYREDLDRVVRPRRPAMASSTERPAPFQPTKPTPLVLVSEQRIDRPRAAETAIPAEVATSAPRTVMPVRPRRVMAVATAQASELNDDIDQDDDLNDEDAGDDEDGDNVFNDNANFSEFAERLGATRLPELLEAAAVYCAEVLNRPQFSRPLVLRQVTSLPESNGATREDCLRGFGTLMRQGRISKVGRGTFAVTEHSPYLAEVRKIAG